jgi:hypothetical protein
MVDGITGQLGLIRTLRGLTPEFGSFDDEQFNEVEFERHLDSNPHLANPACRYWIRKLQARFYAGDDASALVAADKAERLLWAMPPSVEVPDYHFYGALARAKHLPCRIDRRANPALESTRGAPQAARGLGKELHR